MSLGDAEQFFSKLPRSKDRAIHGIASEIVAELDSLRVSTQPEPAEQPIPPDVARMMDRAVLFLSTDQPYVHDRWGLGSFVLLGGFLVGLVLLVVTAVVAEVTGREPASWLMTVGLWMVVPYFGLLMLWGFLSHFVSAIVVFCVRVLRKDLTAYEEADDEYWPFADRASWDEFRAATGGLAVTSTADESR